MKSEAPYTAKRLREFSSISLMPRLGADFVLFKRKDPMRMLTNFIQVLTMTGGRYGETLKVYPTVYVAGAYNWDEVITQSVVTTKDGNGWLFQDRALEADLADEILGNYSKAPCPRHKGLKVTEVIEALSKIARESVDERGALYLAFFLMANDFDNAMPWIKLAQEMFMKNNKKIVHDWQHLTAKRIDVLRSRLELSAVDRMHVCRQEADQHAKLLGLPDVEWHI